MGVSRVYFWPSPRPDMMTELSDHLGSLDAVSVGQSLLFCRVYRHVTAAASKPFLCVWSSSDPAHVVTVLGGKVAVHANRDLDLLLTRFKATYPLQNTIRIDVRVSSLARSAWTDMGPRSPPSSRLATSLSATAPAPSSLRCRRNRAAF